MTTGDVWSLDSEKGASLLYAAGSPEADAWHVANAEPHDLTPGDPLILPDEPEPDFPDVPNDPVPDLGPEAPDEPTLPKED